MRNPNHIRRAIPTLIFSAFVLFLLGCQTAPVGKPLLSAQIVSNVRFCIVTIFGGLTPREANEISALINRGEIDPADQLLLTISRQSQKPTIGRGVFVAPDGRIFTANHAANGAIVVVFRNRGVIVAAVAQVAEIDRVNDVCILKVSTDVSNYIAIAAVPPKENDLFFVVKRTGEVRGVAVVSSRQHQISKTSLAFSKLTIDCFVDSGDSGGPVVDGNGHLVGIITHQREMSRSKRIVADVVIPPPTFLDPHVGK
jgi:S1-C subfamily serine protease